jgi:hypothetical protein
MGTGPGGATMTRLNVVRALRALRSRGLLGRREYLAAMARALLGRDGAQ